MEQAFGFGAKGQRPALPSPWLPGSTAHCCALMGVQTCWPWVRATFLSLPFNEGSNWAGFVLGWSRKAERFGLGIASLLHPHLHALVPLTPCRTPCIRGPLLC